MVGLGHVAPQRLSERGFVLRYAMITFPQVPRGSVLYTGGGPLLPFLIDHHLVSVHLIGLKFQKILDFIIPTGVLYDGGVGGWVGDLKYLRGNLKYLRES